MNFLKITISFRHMKKFIYLCWIFLLFGCSPAEKNSYIPPLKFVNISNEINIDKKEKSFRKIKSIISDNEKYKLKSNQQDSIDFDIKIIDIDYAIDCGQMNDERYVDYIKRIFDSSLTATGKVKIDNLVNPKLELVIFYDFISLETGTRWRFSTNKPKEILVGNPAYGLDPYRVCQSSGNLEKEFLNYLSNK